MFKVNWAWGVAVSQIEPDVGHGLTWQFTFVKLSKSSMLRITAVRAAMRVME